MQETNLVKQTKKLLIIYHCAVIGLYIVAMLFLLSMRILLRTDFDSSTTELSPSILFIIVSCIGLITGILHGLGLYFVNRQTNANWTFQLVLVCLGLTSFLTLPLAIFILIKLINPEVKAYFNAH